MRYLQYELSIYQKIKNKATIIISSYFDFADSQVNRKKLFLMTSKKGAWKTYIIKTYSNMGLVYDTLQSKTMYESHFPDLVGIFLT